MPGMHGLLEIENIIKMKDLFLKVHKKLPVFEIKHGKFIILYTPGFAVKMDKEVIPNPSLILANPESIEDLKIRNTIEELLKNAELATYRWETQKKLPFAAECLTIHVGSDCNMDCPYCFSKSEKTNNKAIIGFPDKKAIESIALYMVQLIKDKTKRLTVVYHGSGEPTLHWKQLTDSHQSIIKIANQFNIEVFFYIATNGCLTESQVDWLVKNINLIGISCDGPDDIQNKQRPLKNKKYIPIPKICPSIIEKGGEFDIRVTITRETISRQTEIAKFLIEECNAKNIRIEPFYLAGENSLTENEAEDFFNHFIKAKKYSEQFGVNYTYAGVRPEEQHGTYCDVLRNTLRLTNDGHTRNCFCYMHDNAAYITGKYDPNLEVFKPVLDIDELKRKGSQIPAACHDCINVYHCSRGCPDFCVVEDVNETNNLNPFRCRLHQLLAVKRIKGFVEKQSETNY
jgi:sulfatase maturation enzyme AslB (radical SAM superfamily)